MILFAQLFLLECFYYMMYSNGVGVLGDRTKAKEWITKAAVQGYEILFFHFTILHLQNFPLSWKLS